jgi:2,4-dienoyl-CoA reductase-like NADH-dependent reductase (Old Yellow Enzyme family)
LGAVEYAAGAESSLAEAMQVLQWLKEAGLDFVDVGLSFATAAEQVPWAPNLMLPFAERIRHACGLPVGTSWCITQAKEADAFIRDQQVDLVFLARTLLANPHWPYQAARDLGIDAAAGVLPTPYAYWLANWHA